MMTAFYSVQNPAIFLQKNKKFLVFHDYIIIRIIHIVKFFSRKNGAVRIVLIKNPLKIL